ncbi:MAG TPA: peptidyl-prolyl cis-trans isomerase [Nocardioidaceae bacterium]|nr:peptidyl-prolyl cis-trans isomerase [Nocardioidaceae bacterium]
MGTALAALAVVLGARQLGGLPAEAAFEYDGKVVTEAELERHIDTLSALYGIQEPAADDAHDRFRRDIAKAVAVSMILDDAARAQDIVISDKSARDTLADMIEGQLGSEQAFTELLSKFTVSEEDILGEVKRQQAVARLFQDRTSHAVGDLTPTDIRAYYEQDPSKFATPERRTLRNIVVTSRAEAAGLLEQLRRGAKFAALARQTSMDDATRDKGGLLGSVTSSELDPAYADAAFAAAEGTSYGPVQTRFGWNVGLVVAALPGHEGSFAEVEEQVTDALRSERALEAWREWLAGQIREADVEYAAAYLPSNPDEPPSPVQP